MDLKQYGGLEISEVEENIEPGKYVMQYVDEQEIRNDSGWVRMSNVFSDTRPLNMKVV